MLTFYSAMKACALHAHAAIVEKGQPRAEIIIAAETLWVAVRSQMR